MPTDSTDKVPISAWRGLTCPFEFPTAWRRDIAVTRITSVTDEHQNPRPSRAWTRSGFQMIAIGRATRPRKEVRIW
jgi:hypothetical protein